MTRFCHQSVTMSVHYDVIMTGTGAGGGTLAHLLAASGQR
jgi:choline dehydrogenase-like flavoprotein